MPKGPDFVLELTGWRIVERPEVESVPHVWTVWCSQGRGDSKRRMLPVMRVANSAEEAMTLAKQAGYNPKWAVL